jgi:hypothetical protein
MNLGFGYAMETGQSLAYSVRQIMTNWEGIGVGKDFADADPAARDPSQICIASVVVQNRSTAMEVYIMAGENRAQKKMSVCKRVTSAAKLCIPVLRM